jgi:3-deoxy-D-manno-octulosonic-acid transferase
LPPLSLTLYAAATRAAAPLAPVLLRRRARRGKEDAARLNERLGRPTTPRPGGVLIWLHGASVGESLSLLPLIDALRTARPDAGVLVTSGTVTSAALLAKRLPQGVVHQFAPVDTPAAVGGFLDHWRPDLGVFVESELWPNLLLAAKARGTKLALVSARVTEKSAAGWSRAPRAAACLLAAFDLILPQDDAAAGRLARFGAQNAGRLNLKLLGRPLPADADALPALRAQAAGRPVLIAASTHPGEDEIVMDAWRGVSDRALLVIVPRHPERADQIVEAARVRRLSAGRRSKQDALGAHDVHVADTLGELGLWFRLGAAAFIGGSLVEGPGGHNPVEPALLDCPIISGFSVHNWASVYEPLFAGGAASGVNSLHDLSAAFFAVLHEPAQAAARARRAKQLTGGQEAMLAAAVRRLADLLQ